MGPSFDLFSKKKFKSKDDCEITIAKYFYNADSNPEIRDYVNSETFKRDHEIVSQDVNELIKKIFTFFHGMERKSTRLRKLITDDNNYLDSKFTIG